MADLCMHSKDLAEMALFISRSPKFPPLKGNLVQLCIVSHVGGDAERRSASEVALGSSGEILQ